MDYRGKLYESFEATLDNLRKEPLDKYLSDTKKLEII